ncbi:hypothetical protein KDW_28270 [Dictyobacter vulcani]|uniref:YvlB/LiaX N-terminal domain-containing protein n=1 Tax=Dictyobacter vulcani TaxID=2607529 RepID=A0A5J4KLD2_9CHLR|nr:hypothetical protein [Dictyobacter vulcani]GER88665.1 hypothetical protein KDW_28270 [Dictyobacter vulcani]
MKKTISAENIQSLTLRNINDELNISGWDQPSIEIETDSEFSLSDPENQNITIQNSQDRLTIKVPYETSVYLSEINDHVSIEQVQEVQAQRIHDDLHLQDIQGQVTLEELHGDLVGKNIGTLKTRRRIEGDVSLSAIGLAELESVESDLNLKNIEKAVIGSVGNDLAAREVASLSVNNVGNGCQIADSPQAEITLGNIGHDLEIKDVAQVVAGNIGSDVEIRGVSGNVTLGSVGSDARLITIGGDVQLGTIGSDAILQDIKGSVHGGTIGSDASLQGVHGSINLGTIGSDLHLQADFAPGNGLSFIRTGSDALIVLPEHPNLTIQASVGGDITGRSLVSSKMGNRATLVYGEGAARLDLAIGGDLHLKGDAAPESSSSNDPARWGDFANEMATLGRDMGTLGRDLGAEISAAITSEFTSKVQQRNTERAEKQRQKAEERARRQQDRAARFNFRVRDREWSMDPERINRIVEQAERAASEGIMGAMEAVEQALRNMNAPQPPTPPVPPKPAGGPVPPKPPMPPTPADPYAAYPAHEKPTQAQTERAQPEVPVAPTEPASATTPVDIEQEREAILRMIAEGRISPEEGDMLLEALLQYPQSGS